MEILRKNILKTLLYYDIFSHPLKSDEVFTFLPQNSVSKDNISDVLKSLASDPGSPLAEKNGYYYLKPKETNVSSRISKENHSRKMWRYARLVTHIIKRFPFIRAAMVTGSLSKNSSDSSSDLDFMVITAKNRLWIARTMLMLFKKIFLLNSYKFFCINYYISEDFLEIENRNIFTATEIATIKATYNSNLLEEFLNANKWITDFFPNYVLCDPALHLSGCKVSNRRSILQVFTELLFIPPLAKKLDKILMEKTRAHWNRKYAHIDKDERDHMFRSTDKVSKTHPLNMQKRILGIYNDKLKEFNL
jgi:hypothetical protein